MGAGAAGSLTGAAELFRFWVFPDCTFLDISNGNDLTAFKKDPISGEVHTEFEWSVIQGNTVPNRKGSYDGEKANTYFEWDSAIEEWLWTGP